MLQNSPAASAKRTMDMAYQLMAAISSAAAWACRHHRGTKRHIRIQPSGIPSTTVCVSSSTPVLAGRAPDTSDRCARLLFFARSFFLSRKKVGERQEIETTL